MKSVTILKITCAILLAGIIFYCGDDDTVTEPEPNVPAELIGTWIYQSVTINEIPVSLDLVLGWQPETEFARFTVSEDESFLYEELDSSEVVQWTESGTFTVNGNQATISITNDDNGPVDPPEVFAGTWTLDENELTLTTTLGGTTVVFVAIKQLL